MLIKFKITISDEMNVQIISLIVSKSNLKLSAFIKESVLGFRVHIACAASRRMWFCVQCTEINEGY